MSRSPFAYQRRKRSRPLNWPAPSFSPGQLLIHQYSPAGDKSLQELIAGEGAPPADRVVLPDWSPPHQEEQ